MAPANPQGPAQDAISAFIQDLADRGLAASTRRVRRHFLNEAFRHAQQEAGTSSLSAAEMMRPERAAAWLADAAAGRTRTRNTMRGPEAGEGGGEPYFVGLAGMPRPAPRSSSAAVPA